MKALVFLAFLGVALPVDLNERVVGGYECPRNSVPYQASLNIAYHFCGGSLISSQWVVSAAHCYKSRIQVRLGEHDIAVNEGTEHTTATTWTTTSCSSSSPALRNSYVQAVTLPSRCPVADEECLVSGWGNVATNGHDYPDRLQCLRQPMIDDRICRNAYPHLVYTRVCHYNSCISSVMSRN
ncbi:hypothetical protein CRUP_003187 [Coryphaenoides rupestris]|nr:hypothetical protein CRUP_003187 [Coryphaenoides rupestris]